MRPRDKLSAHDRTEEGTSSLKNISETGGIFLQLAQPWLVLDPYATRKCLVGASQRQFLSLVFKEGSKPEKVTLPQKKIESRKKCRVFGKTGEE